MQPKILNRAVIVGAVIYGVLNVIFGWMTLAVFAYLSLNLYPTTSPAVDVATYCAPFWLVFAIVAGWLVASESTRIALASELDVSLRFAVLCGSVAVALGLSPIALFIIYALIGSIGHPFINLLRYVELFGWLLALVCLGALGGALYFWISGRRVARSIVVAAVENAVSAPRVDE